MPLPPLFWDRALSYEISPKSGPLRRMVTLADVRSAMVYDLPRDMIKQPPWLNAGMLLVAASETGRQIDIRDATDALCDALDFEGWLSAAALAKA